MDRRDFFKAGLAAGLAGLTGFTPLKVFGSQATLPGENLLIVEGGTAAGRYLAGIELLGGIGQFVKKGQKVVVKPAMAFDCMPDSGLTTNPFLVKEIIKQCYKAGAKAVSVFEHTRGPWTKCYKNSGIERIAKDASARVLPANHEMYYSTVNLAKPQILKSVKINKTLLDADVLINVPVVCFNREGMVEASISNLLGCVWDFDFFEKNGYSQSLPELLYYIKPKLNIVDATTIRPQTGTGEILKPGVLVFSTNCVAADSLACQLAKTSAGVNLYVKKAGELGFGNPDVALSDVKKIFARV